MVAKRKGLELSLSVMSFRSAISILQLFVQGPTLQAFLHEKWGKPYLNVDVSKLMSTATRPFEMENYVYVDQNLKHLVL